MEPFIEPIGESRNDVLIMAAIAEKLGFGHLYPQNDDEFRQWLLDGVTPYARGFVVGTQKKEHKYDKYKSGELRADGKVGFPTPSGKFEICSVILEENGYTPYPEYLDMRSIPELSSPEFPFTMTTGARSNHRCGTLGANIDKIVAIEPCPLMDVNEDDALELGINNGDMVTVTTPFGEGMYTARVCGVARNVIHIPHGGGSAYMPKLWKEGNVNDLCSLDYHDAITGFVTIKSIPCRIEKSKI